MDALAPHKSKTRPIRVMVVDDSAVIRSVISTILRTDPAIEVIGMASNGKQAVENITAYDPDIVILDIEMPFMDGITALPLLLEKKPKVKILICSTLSERGADISIKALALGATECLLKPSGSDAIQQRRDFHEDLLRLVRSLGARTVQAEKPATQIVLHKAPLVTLPPKVLAIGSSTGGPNALMLLLKYLPNLSVPIVITQHMPKTFTAMLANHITQATGVTCLEGAEGMAIKPGHAYVAPGGYHMILQKQGTNTVIHLDEGVPENFCRPSVDPMLRSLGEVYGAAVLIVILTGMGSDGLPGCQHAVKIGARVIAQDEASSVVWGMPGAVANAGICSAIGPIPELADFILKTIPLQTKTGGSTDVLK
jgi:two-component system chemotaxis response regulator CheB